MPARPEVAEALWNRYAGFCNELWRDGDQGWRVEALARLSEEIAEEARKEEREACAKIVEDGGCSCQRWDKHAVYCDLFKAAEIRSRSRPSPREPAP
jgi:hypothetical protein